MGKGSVDFPHQRSVQFSNDDMETALTAKEKYGTAIGTFIRLAYRLGKKAALDQVRREAAKTAAIRAKKRAKKDSEDGA